MIAMKAHYWLATPWPSDVENPSGNSTLMWNRVGNIPFVPVAGHMIDCGDGDFRETDQVFWKADDPDQVEVHFKNEEVDRQSRYYLDAGWRSDDLQSDGKELSTCTHQHPNMQ